MSHSDAMTWSGTQAAETILAKLDEGLKAADVDYVDYVDVWRLVASTPGEHTPAEEEEFYVSLSDGRMAGYQ
jgi:hypothetical protein